MRACVSALVLLIAPWALHAQGAPAPAYRAADFACARFSERAMSDIEIVSGRTDARGTAGREGTWVFCGRDTVTGVAFDAWYDDLRVWREVGKHRTEPDTDGILGGRFVGLLGATGGVTLERRPWVPEEVGETSDVAAALDDLLPPLPPYLLQVGEHWRSADTIEVRRLADSAGLQRYREQSAKRTALPAALADSLRPDLKQVVSIRGQYVWHPTKGLLRAERTIETRLDLPRTAARPLALRTRVVQRIELSRLTSE